VKKRAAPSHNRHHELSPGFGGVSTVVKGVPVEIVSKVICGMLIFSTTQRYLDKVGDEEAMRWMGNLCG
jgi:hypothetical protein